MTDLLDLDALEALARAVNEPPFGLDMAECRRRMDAYDDALNPPTVLALIAAARAVPPLQVEVDRLREALRLCMDWIIELAESGDAGFWNAEEMPQVIAARAALTPSESGEG